MFSAFSKGMIKYIAAHVVHTGSQVDPLALKMQKRELCAVYIVPCVNQVAVYNNCELNGYHAIMSQKLTQCEIFSLFTTLLLVRYRAASPRCRQLSQKSTLLSALSRGFIITFHNLILFLFFPMIICRNKQSSEHVSVPNSDTNLDTGSSKKGGQRISDSSRLLKTKTICNEKQRQIISVKDLKIRHQKCHICQKSLDREKNPFHKNRHCFVVVRVPNFYHSAKSFPSFLAYFLHFHGTLFLAIPITRKR